MLCREEQGRDVLRVERWAKQLGNAKGGAKAAAKGAATATAACVSGVSVGGPGLMREGGFV